MASRDKGPSTPMKVIIIVFAVILVVSLCLPFFSSCSSSSTDSSQTDASSASTQDAKSTSQVDEDNQTIVDSITSKHADDPTSLAALGALGNAYMDWGGSLQQASDASANADHVKDVYGQAVDYYDQYLSQKADSNSVRVNRAVCQYYAGDEDGAVRALEDFTSENGDFSPAWMNLGVFYEMQGDSDKARSAYSECVTADAVDSYNLASYAQLRVAIMDAYSASASASSSADGDASSSSAADSSRAVSSRADASSTRDAASSSLPDAELALNAPLAAGN